MTYAIAAAGTGGHVYPGIAVAQALVGSGVSAEDVVFFGGNRLEAAAVPDAGFTLVELELRGLSRSLDLRNLWLPVVVGRAAGKVRSEMERRGIAAVLCMGGYVTVPVAYAARRHRIALFLHEQNAHAGLANRLVARWAERTFVAFPHTTGLDGEAIGNPLRSAFVDFDAPSLRTSAFAHYRLDPEVATVGVSGGSLGAKVINSAVDSLAADWDGPPLQIVHLVGRIHQEVISTVGDAQGVTRRVVGFEDRMDLFYAVSDLAVARAGGGLFEVAASGTPVVVVPGSFGGGHQADNARAMEEAGAAMVVDEAALDSLGTIIGELLADPSRRAAMGNAARRAARPGAAETIAAAMMEAAHA